MSKKKFIVIMVLLISFSVLSLIGTTYALFTKTVKGDKTVKITSGNLNIDFKEGSNIQLENASPTEDEEGLKMDSYTFTIENNGDVKSYYNISIKEDESNTLNNNYVRYSLTSNKGYDSGVRVMGGEGSSEFIIKSEEKIEVGDNIQYSLRLWLDKDVDNSVQGQSYKARVVVNGYSNKTKNATEVLLTQFTNDESIQDYDVNYTKEDSTAKENKMYVFRHDKTEQTPELIDYRYIGKDPNNYVKFNNELWRIIGVETVENGTGIKEKRIKLIRKDSLPAGTNNYMSWDNKPNGTGSTETQYGSNDWYDSRLMYLLNPNHEEEQIGVSGSIYWNRQSGKCPIFSSSGNGTIACDFSGIGLLSEARTMIGDAKWYLGGTSNYYTSDNGTSNHWYSYERGKIVYKSTNHPRKINWTGKVGLMYPSDYGYATSGGETVNRKVCLTKELSLWNNNEEGIPDCYNNDWLYNSSNSQWTITPHINGSSRVFIIPTHDYNAYNNYGVQPVVYLVSNIKLLKGTGSENDPFVFEE